MQGHQEHRKNHHDKVNHLETQNWHDHWKNPKFDYDYLIGLRCQ
jgi:hypothetical protein